MNKLFLLTAFSCMISFFAFSQNDESLVKIGAKGLFIEHKVAAKENFYSIGRAFAVHPKHLASFNGLDMSKGLSLGQAVNIPLSDSNVNRSSKEGTPLYYKSSLKQTVGSISALSKTPAENIRSWNQLSNDVAPNTAVIIGYLIAGNDATAVAPPATKTIDTAKVSVEKVAEKKENVVVQKPTEEIKQPVVTKIDSVKKELASATSEEKKTALPAMAGDGYFKSLFEQQIKVYPLSKEETVTSGIFKTMSRSTEGKYYAIIDGVEPGTIIRITNPDNNKAIYAKVLGQVNDIRQNQGLDLRISNTAAALLEIKETDKFIVKVNY
ncbi:MAG: hypothetical protein QM764_01025 [Chitinophagaceae bacterium]